MNLSASHTFTAPSASTPMLQMLEHLATCHYEEQVLLEMASLLVETVPLKIEDFPLVADSYSRTILHRDGSGFEAMVARWSKGAITPIHGHPQFTFVYLISGELTLELFEKEGGFVSKQQSLICSHGEHIYSQGTANRFDNAIHRVRANQDSLTLHIYSDNALKGEIFSTSINTN